MQITSTLLEQITGIRDVHFESSARDKRHAPRIPLSTCVNLILVKHLQPTAPIPARTRDISTSGIGILCSRPLRPGESFLIQLPRKAQSPLWIVCQVKCCRPASDDLFILGATFVALHRPHTAPPPSLAPAPAAR